MRRKSERAATKKVKASPEKKVEKVKRAKTRRSRKQSASSENDSADDNTPAQVKESVIELEKKAPETPAKEDSPEDAADQVWHVKAAQSSTDSGEIQKLKICLTRPPTTPERVDRSPRSKRKQTRATSSSDSVEPEDKKKKHRKRSIRESKDDIEKNHDSQEETEQEPDQQENIDKVDHTITQSTDVKKMVSEDTPISTSSEPAPTEVEKGESNENEIESGEADQSSTNNEETKQCDVDTTVESPKEETKSDENASNNNIEVPTQSEPDDNDQVTTAENNKTNVEEQTKDDLNMSQDSTALTDHEVSIEDKTENSVSEAAEISLSESIETINKTDVVASTAKVEIEELQKKCTDSGKVKNSLDESIKEYNEQSRKTVERSDSTQSGHEETTHNGQAAPLVLSRKRKWGSRPNKITKQKSITISTDVLKDIIPDVKPVEFEEVIEEKKQHKRVEVNDKIQRPVLPKIVIDNTENVEREKERDEKENAKLKETHLALNRKISIINDHDSIIARPPSPPKHKQSCILYITNLVRPFTLPQLKNLLQRTGRIVEGGFWIDRIKSKCFVIYENEDQAVETRHALHGVTWPVSNPKTLQVDFSSQEDFDNAKLNEDTNNTQASTIPGTVEDWLREQDQKRERGEIDKPWERKAVVREWDVGKGDKDKEKDKLRRDDRPMDKRRHRTPERSPEPAKKFKKKEEEAPAKLLDDLFRKTKTTPCIYWLPLSAETIAIKEEQRRQHMAEHERRLQELRRTHRRH